MTIGELINLGAKKLSTTSDSPILDSEVLLSHLLNQPKEYLLINPDKKINSEIEEKFKILLNRRLKGWPVAYLKKEKEFFGLKFYVDKNVLIPRPETEGLVELVISQFKSRKNLRILDLGTGSGCIIISLAKNLSDSNKYFASDISAKALAVAKRNAKFHKVKVNFKPGSLLVPWKNQQLDIIVANLPYLAQRTDVSTKFEPTKALIAADKGLRLFEELFKQSHSQKFIKFIFLEIGHDQALPIKKLGKKFLPEYRTQIFKDLSGRDRYAAMKRVNLSPF